MIQRSKRKLMSSYLGGTGECPENHVFVTCPDDCLWVFSQVFPSYANGNRPTSSTWVSAKIKEKRAAAKKAAEESAAQKAAEESAAEKPAEGSSGAPS